MGIKLAFSLYPGTSFLTLNYKEHIETLFNRVTRQAQSLRFSLALLDLDEIMNLPDIRRDDS